MGRAGRAGRTGGAEAPELDVARDDMPEGGRRLVDPQVIELPVLEVEGGAAMRADEVVVGGGVGVEADALAEGADR